MSVLTSIFAGSIAATSPSAMEQCELHIWTTRNFHAVFHGAAPVYGGIQMYLSALEDVKQRLAESIDEGAQIEAIKALNLEGSGKFSGYKVAYHKASVPGKYDNWLDKSLGIGSRDSESTATCYSEIHVVLITLFRTALSKKIQTVFLFSGLRGRLEYGLQSSGGWKHGGPGLSDKWRAKKCCGSGRRSNGIPRESAHLPEKEKDAETSSIVSPH